MIKPDAVAAGHVGKILDRIIQEKFAICALKMYRLTVPEAKRFYAVHAKQPFFEELVEYVSSGAVILMVLQKENAVQEWRDLIGATDPKEAKENTIRRLFAKSKAENAVHGSDSKETALQEISFFFSGCETAQTC